MCRPEMVWGGIIAAGAAAEMHALTAGHHNCTLSAMTRRVCHTQHPAGRVIFIAGVYLLAAWFCHHITAWKDPTTMSNSGYSGWGHQVTEAKTPRSGWTELADVTVVSLASVETQYIAATDTAGSASWVTGSRAGGIIVEVKAAGETPVGKVPPLISQYSGAF